MVLAGLKERFEGCESLLGTSPIVRLISSNKPQKPLIATVTNPSGGSKNKRTTSSGQNGSGNDTADGEKVPVLPRTQNSSGAAHGMHIVHVRVLLTYLNVSYSVQLVDQKKSKNIQTHRHTLGQAHN